MNRGDKSALVIAFIAALMVHGALAVVHLPTACSTASLQVSSSDGLRISFPVVEAADKPSVEDTVPDPAEPALEDEKKGAEPLSPDIHAPAPEPPRREMPVTRNEPVETAPLEPPEPAREVAEEKNIEKQRQDRVASAAPETGRERVMPGTALLHSEPGEEEAREPLVPAVPRYRDNPPPRYPDAALRRGQEGLVLLSVIVGVDGSPREVALKRSSGYDILNRSAMEAVRNWRFDPATRGGKPFEMTVEVPVRFELRQDRW